MVKLTDTHLMVLSAAAQQSTRVVTLPDRLTADERSKLAKALIKWGLVEEVPSKGRMPSYRQAENGQRISLIITDVGLAAIGIEEEARGDQTAAGSKQRAPQPARKVRHLAKEGRVDAPPVADKPVPSRPARTHKARTADSESFRGDHHVVPRDGSKLAQVTALLNRPDGANLDEMVSATGWLPHTTRAALTGLRKRGYRIERQRSDEGKSIYRIVLASAHAVAA